ncbi:MD-2-related lipid-recognition protein ROSY1-like isoform X2 [Hibiscus syriacus]|uniref:MD-2-related lipid-recognition protein ROSY1-like isoform X2 n=1 Tax=Hibiscus syriacus TaxID=106335 RepID=UPI001922C1C9|nr:MD-2-related lipid-recognition protein ROSY1-like isoform X2 [Hibiscus syriacus]
MDTVAPQFKLTLLAISLLFLPFLQATDFKYCDKEGNYVVKVSGIEISPNPVARGKPATFTISASTGQAISGGKAVIDVSYFGVHIHQETHSLCQETTCPVSVGNFVLSHNQVLPGFTPPVSFTNSVNFFYFENIYRIILPVRCPYKLT